MTTQLALAERTSGTENKDLPSSPAHDVGSLLTLAIERGITPDGLSKLLDLQERVIKRNAESAFNEAMQDFQAQCPVIGHDRTVNTGKFGYTYATLAHIAETIGPLLSQLGLSYSFNTKFITDVVDLGGGKSVERPYIRARCTVHHVAGHSRSATFQAPIDRGTPMNSMQQSASAQTYAKRYALIAAFGLTTAETDDDGRGAGRQPNDSPQADMNAPKTATREKRNDLDAKLKALKKRWYSLLGSFHDPEQHKSAFENWVEGVTGIKGGSESREWTQQAFDACNADLNDEEQGQ